MARSAEFLDVYQAAVLQLQQYVQEDEHPVLAHLLAHLADYQARACLCVCVPVDR